MLPYLCYADVSVQDQKCSLIHTFKYSILHFNIISFHPITFTRVCKFNVFVFDKAQVKKYVKFTVISLSWSKRPGYNISLPSYVTDQQAQAHRKPAGHSSQWKIRFVASVNDICTPPFPLFFSTKEHPQAIDFLITFIILINQ